MSTLELQQIGKSFQSVTVLDRINLQVTAGSRTAIVGPSGSGKTTLLRIIAGFETPITVKLSCKAIRYSTIQPTCQRTKEGLVFVPQDGALFPHFTVAGNIGYGLKGTKQEKARRVDELMEMVALIGGYQLQLWPHEISGGQQQRVALARALAQRPVLMLLDEPFQRWIPRCAPSTRKAVAELLAQANIASILVTHDQTEALSFASQVAVMRAGKLAHGPPQELYLRPVDEPTATFLGETLILSANIDTGWADCALGKVRVDDEQRHGLSRIMLRPEQITITPLPADHHYTTHCMAKVINIDFAGFISTLTFYILLKVMKR